MMTDQEIEDFVKNDESLQKELQLALKLVPGLKESCDLIPMTVYMYGERLQHALAVFMVDHVTQRQVIPGQTFEETVESPTNFRLKNWTVVERIRAIQPKLNVFTHETIGPRLMLLRDLVTKDAPSFRALKVMDIGINDDETEFAITANWHPEDTRSSTMSSPDEIKRFIIEHAKDADLVLVRGFLISPFMLASGTRSAIRVVHMHQDAEMDEEEVVDVFRHVLANVRPDATYILLDIFDDREISEVVQEFWTRSNTTTAVSK